MKKVAEELLEIINDHGYEAYVVGGFVRNMLLNLESKDIDVTTNATPMELKNIFSDIDISNKSYGSVTLYYKEERFEITTYRMENEYFDNRHPNSIIYVNDLKTDLLRRDFTINTICLDKNGNIVDLLNGRDDLNKKVINTVYNSVDSFSTDVLRILRAVRFATILNFALSDEIILAIKKTKHLLKKLSYNRKKQELDYIFGSVYAKEGIQLLKKLDLIDVLELNNIDRVKDYTDLIGIWAMINPTTYKFNNSEKDLIKKINIVYEKDNLNEMVLYKYGLYVNILAGINKGIKKQEILKKYNNLLITSRSDIKINVMEISSLLNKTPDYYLNDILCDIEEKILNKKLANKEKDIKEYILSNYK